MNNALQIHPKVVASGLAGAIVVVIVYCLHQWAHTDLPDVVSAALVVIFGSASGWLAKSPAAPTVLTAPTSAQSYSALVPVVAATVPAALPATTVAASATV